MREGDVMKNKLTKAAFRGERLLVPLACLAIVILSLACPTSGDNSGIDGLGSNESWAGKKQKNFWADNLKNKTSYQIKARLLAENSRCQVWAEDGGKTRERVTTNIAAKLAAEFENNIYSLVISNFGPPSDVDGNGKIIILLLDIQDGYTPDVNPSYVGGYFSGAHCLSGPAYPASNKADMVFVDTWPATPGDENSNLTLAHEFQHLVNFNHHYIEAASGAQRWAVTWLDEGLACATEYLYLTQKRGTPTHNIQRVEYYKNDPYEDIRNGINFVTWGPNYIVDPYSNYSAAYLFFQWLRIQAGEEVYKKIAGSAHNDYQAVQAAVWDLKSTALGNSWADMLQNWFIANAFCASTGMYGYKGDSVIGTLQKYPEWYPANINSSATISLASGEGIYVKPTTTYIPGGAPANIRYEGLNVPGKHTGWYTSEQVLLVVNINGVVGPTPVTGIPIPNSSIVREGQLNLSRSAAPARPLVQGLPRPVDRVIPVDVRMAE